MSTATVGVENAQQRQANNATCQFPHITKENIGLLNYFEIFGLETPTPNLAAGSAGKDPDVGDATIPVIDVAAVRRVYRRLSLRFHPDKDSSDEARHAFEVVHTALETIIDSSKLAAYVDTLSRRVGGTESSSVPDEELRQRHRAQQAHEEAEWAADRLAQRAQERLAKEAALRKAAEEREVAAQRLLSELTSSLNTPFKLMEAELVRDWDVDEEMVAMKTEEIMKLLCQLEPAESAWMQHSLPGGGLRKREREEAVR